MEKFCIVGKLQYKYFSHVTLVNNPDVGLPSSVFRHSRWALLPWRTWEEWPGSDCHAFQAPRRELLGQAPETPTKHSINQAAYGQASDDPAEAHIGRKSSNIYPVQCQASRKPHSGTLMQWPARVTTAERMAWSWKPVRGQMPCVASLLEHGGVSEVIAAIGKDDHLMTSFNMQLVGILIFFILQIYKRTFYFFF